VVEDRHEELKQASGVPTIEIPTSSSERADAPGLQTAGFAGRNEYIRFADPRFAILFFYSAHENNGFVVINIISNLQKAL